jgi:hypothetical protein
MSKIRLPLQCLALLVFTLTLTSAVQAQATRTWVSGVGDDVNPCSRTAPCKTFAGAISKTAAGGEIDALDPGGFGTVTITKSITIDGNGTHASILASATNGVNVNDSATATPGTIAVTLRNLSINGAGTTLGINGINFTSGKILKVENCRILNFSSNGINVSIPVTSSEVYVYNTVISNCNGSAYNHNAGPVVASIDRSVLEDSGTGLTNAAGVVTITNSLISGNTNNGVTATSGAAQLNVIGNQINHNGAAGVNASGGSVVRIGNNDIIRNAGAGFSNTSTMESFRNNRIRGNNLANVGVLTDISAVNTGIF